MHLQKPITRPAGFEEGFIVNEVNCSTCKGSKYLLFERGARQVPCVTCSGSGIDWRKTFESAQSELSALREENERLKSGSFEELYNAAIDERDALLEELAEIKESLTYRGSLLNRTQQRAEAAEQRNAELVELLTEAMPHLNTAASAFKAVKPIRDKVRDALKPTESGASE